METIFNENDTNKFDKWSIILDVLTLNVKTHGYYYVPVSELIWIYYMIYFRHLVSMNPGYERNNKSINETILIESSFDMSKK